MWHFLNFNLYWKKLWKFRLVIWHLFPSSIIRKLLNEVCFWFHEKCSTFPRKICNAKVYIKLFIYLSNPLIKWNVSNVHYAPLRNFYMCLYVTWSQSYIHMTKRRPLNDRMLQKVSSLIFSSFFTESCWLWLLNNSKHFLSSHFE